MLTQRLVDHTLNKQKMLNFAYSQSPEKLLCWKDNGLEVSSKHFTRPRVMLQRSQGNIIIIIIIKIISFFIPGIKNN